MGKPTKIPSEHRLHKGLEGVQVEQVKSKKTPAQRDDENKTFQNQLRIVMNNCTELARMCSTAERTPRAIIETLGLTKELMANLVAKTSDSHKELRKVIYALREEQERQRRLEKL